MRAVVLAAGQGVRLEPLTHTRPKCMLPIAGRPLLEWIFEALAEAGISEALLILNPKGEAVKKAYGASWKRLKLTYAWDENPRGTGASLTYAESYVGSDVFLLVYGDLFLTPRTLKFFVEKGKQGLEGGFSAIAAAAEVSNPSEYGVFQLRGDGSLQRVLEKPRSPPSNLANAGIYLLGPEVFEAVRKVKPSPRGEIELTDALNFMVKGWKIGVVKLPQGSWIDVGRPWDLLEANRMALDVMGGKVEGIIEPQAVVRGKVILERDAVVQAGSCVEGPVYIGVGSRVGPYARLRPYTVLGCNVKVGSFCEVKASLIMDGSKIPHLCYVGDSIIGADCNLGAGTLIGNLRLDEKPVSMRLEGVKVSSGRRKLGAVLGDRVRTAVNVSIMPGVRIGFGSRIGPTIAVTRDIPPETFVMAEQKLVFKPLREEV